MVLTVEDPLLWLVAARRWRQMAPWSVFPSQSDVAQQLPASASNPRPLPPLSPPRGRLQPPPRINVAPLTSKLKQFFHRVPAILIFTWRGQAEDTLAMMKDIFPFPQLGHALTHHYPIDLIHGFPSSSPCLPSPINSLLPSISSASMYIYLWIPARFAYNSPDRTSHNGTSASHLVILAPHHFFHLPSPSFVPFLPPPDSPDPF